MKNIKKLIILLLGIIISYNSYSQNRINEQLPIITNKSNSLISTYNNKLIIEWNKRSDGQWYDSYRDDSGLQIINVTYKNTIDTFLLIYTNHIWYEYPNIEEGIQSVRFPMFFKISNEIYDSIINCDTSINTINLGIPFYSTNIREFNDFARYLYKYYNNQHHNYNHYNYNYILKIY